MAHAADGREKIKTTIRTTTRQVLFVNLTFIRLHDQQRLHFTNLQNQQTAE